MLVLECGVELCDDDREKPLFGGRQVSSVQLKLRVLPHPDAAGEILPPRPRRRDHHVGFHEPRTRQGERLAQAIHERLDGVVTAEHAARDSLDQLGLGRCSPGGAGGAAARSTT
nr:hypothetical protein [Leucobacter luti]